MTSTFHDIPRFTKDAESDRHFLKLRERVNEVMKALPASRISSMRARAVILPVLYFGIYTLALFQTGYFWFCLAYVFLGILVVLIFLNLIHEASHHTLFRTKKNNRRYLLLFDLIGANSFMWYRRHVTLHHNYTNVVGWDSDIEKSQYLKVHPYDPGKKPRHYQHLLIFLYPLFITNWFLVRDFKDFFNPKMIVRKLGNPPRMEYVKLFFFKFFFVCYLVVVPALVTGFQWWQAALALFIMLLSAGFFALSVLLPPHVNTSNRFPVVNANMKLEQSWLMHQLNTTNDVITSNWVTRHIMANCNYHIAHHLFPNISHVYAKEVTEAIHAYCLQAGLPYRSYPFLTTLKNHYKLIKTNGRWQDILEEDL